MWSRAARINLSLLLVCVVAGIALYRGRLAGQGDDLSNLTPVRFPSPMGVAESVVLSWGQVAFGLMTLPWRLAVRVFRLTIDSFPWWLPLQATSFSTSPHR